MILELTASVYPAYKGFLLSNATTLTFDVEKLYGGDQMNQAV
jgi:hypothetical protein